MKIVCAWCQKDMGEREPFDDPITSHGICPACFEIEIKEIHSLPRIFPVDCSDPQLGATAHPAFQI